MKKGIMIVAAVLFIMGAGIFFRPGEALSQDVNFSFGINVAPPPPAVVVTGPPALYVIPGTPVYYVPQIERQLYFYSGNWYRLYDGYWFRATYYNGPWAYISPVGIPYVFRNISPRYYRVPPREQYRPRWSPPRYWRPAEYRPYEYRDRWEDHHDNHRTGGFDGRRNWNDERSNRRWDD